MLNKDILEIDEALHSVASDIDLSHVDPINGDEAKKSTQEPVFNYREKPDYTEIRRKLLSLKCPQTPEGLLLKNKQRFLLDKVALISAVGTQRFFSTSKKIYPLPRKQLVRKATDVLETLQDTKTGNVPLLKACGELQETVNQIGIPWSVKYREMVAGASVKPSERIVYLKQKKLFTRRFIERLKIHEIGTHAIRAENGRLQPLKIFMHGLAHYLPTEEGLAVFNEERFGVLDDTVKRTYAGRTLAVHVAATHSFQEVVEELKKYFSEQKANTIALRVKRGVPAGTDKGGFTKDSAYFAGYTDLKRFEAEGGDFTPLYYGKVGLADLPLLEKFDWLVKPKYFPDMITLK